MPRPLIWLGSSRKDLKALPGEVQDGMGFALYQAQCGLKPQDAKPLVGLGFGVFEIASRFDKDAFRAVYTVHYPQVVYVLHAFQKKSKSGIATPKSDLRKVRERRRAAEEHNRKFYEYGLRI